MQTIKHSKWMALSLAATFLVGMPMSTLAQQPHHRSFFHRHPNATSAAVGYGAYRYAKSRRHGWMHRHPVLTGLAAAALTHHHLKKHDRRFHDR